MSLTDLFRRRPTPTASDHARALGQIGRDNHRAKVRAMAREVARCSGQPIPAILNDKEA